MVLKLTSYEVENYIVGGLFSVALSLTLRWPSVRWNHVLLQPGLYLLVYYQATICYTEV